MGKGGGRRGRGGGRTANEVKNKGGEAFETGITFLGQEQVTCFIATHYLSLFPLLNPYYPPPYFAGPPRSSIVAVLFSPSITRIVQWPAP